MKGQREMVAEAAARRQSDHNVLKSKEEEEDTLRDVRVVVLAANSTG